MMNAHRRLNRLMSTSFMSARVPSASTTKSARFLSSEAPTEERRPAQLARLPMPDLHKTLQHYVQSLTPFLREQEARGGSPFEVALHERLKWAAAFEAGVGADCQRRLIELDHKSPHNWLDDNFWLKKAYHEWRAPLLINSNWWLAFYNDSSVPQQALEGRDTMLSGVGFWQIRRAAWLIYRTLEFKEKIAHQELYPDTTKTGVWFRNTVALMFYTNRIPQLNCDTLSSRPSPLSANARKVFVMIGDILYAVEVYDAEGVPLSADAIERRLQSAVQDYHARVSAGEKAPPVGIMTSDERDSWATNYAHLRDLSSNNRRVLDVILESVFAVSLDPHTLGQEVVETPAEINRHLHNIRSSHNGRNRWFDKAYTIIVENNSRAGAMGEHSPCDALVPSIVAEYSIVQSIDPDAFPPMEEVASRIATAPHGLLEGCERLTFDLDEGLHQACEVAQSRAEALIVDSDDAVYWFQDYGSDWIKDVARLSPDAYVQMALQLTWYKLRGEFTAVYETVLTRLFVRGRTETIRSYTADSREWILVMLDPKRSDNERHGLLRRAIQTHTKLTREAATGKGIDRHLLGLRLMLRDGEHAQLFEDPLFEESQTWKLSTSGLSAGHLFRGTGFGSPYPDGYGINYLCAPDQIKFGVESKFSCASTSTARFNAALAESLTEMRTICAHTSSTSAKL
ncbi:acyltransferase ChoActase/COT/CPT [Peniophora sp. CONT]|nr:acyltransferase ChoActase/COT/CPT [Peniophora sp. CONT]